MKVLQEPLVHFLLLGAGVFLLFNALGNPVRDRPDRIVVSAGHIQHLVEIWERTRQRPPTHTELEGLIEEHIREEVFYREALVLGLERNDTIIRRRLKQKMEFVAEDVAAAITPTEAELQAFLEENSETFRIAPRFTFTHIYLNRQRRGETIVRDAEHLITTLNRQHGEIDTANLGDALLLPSHYEAFPEYEVAKLFGRDFAARLLELEAGPWVGPVMSGYGLHVVRIQERTEGRRPALAEVREAVEREWFARRRRDANEAFYQRLRERYTIVVEKPAPKAAEARP